VLYLNGSKVATSGTALTFDGTYFTANGLRLAGADVTNTIYQATGALGISTGSASGITFYTNLANRYQIDATGVAVWSVGGSEAMRLNATGLGIGTTNPTNTAGFSRQLQIEGTTAALTLSGTTGTGKYTLGVPGTNAFGLWDNTASAYRLFVDSSGNLLVGTTSAGNARFVVRGPGTTSATASLEGATSGGATRFLVSDDGLCRWYGTSNAETMRLDNAGNLGIGTSGPVAKLDVVGGNGDGIQYRTSTRSIGIGQISSQASLFWGSSTDLTFFAGSELARLTSAGNLGIGTSSPAAKLDVVGAIRSSTTTSGSTVSATTDFRLNNATFSRVAIGDGGGGWLGGYSITYSGGAVYSDTGAISGIYYTNGGNILFYAGGSAVGGTAAPERMRLDSSGNLGIGTSSPATKLDVNGDVTQRNGSGTIIGNIQNSSGWYDFKASANVNGAQISTAAATPIRFLPNGVEAARFDSSGNLGIGTSSPTAGFRLDVQATTARQRIESTTGTNEVQQRLINSGGTFFLSLDNSTGTGFGAAYSAVLWHSGNYPMLFATNNTERARISAAGDLLVGTTSSGGTASNATRVTGGIFSTFNATPSIPNNTATTVATLPSGEGMYLVSASLLNSGTAADWNELALVRVSQSNTAVSTIVGAANLDITVSGLNVQVTQRQGATQTIPVAIIRLL
jgi:hypothetical protein